MPAICMFYGIIIRMFSNDHNPPHFHTEYQGKKASFDLHGNLLDGKLPRPQLRMVQAWCEIHYEELVANWELAKNHDITFRIEPLK